MISNQYTGRQKGRWWTAYRDDWRSGNSIIADSSYTINAEGLLWTEMIRTVLLNVPLITMFWVRFVHFTLWEDFGLISSSLRVIQLSSFLTFAKQEDLRFEQIKLLCFGLCATIKIFAFINGCLLSLPNFQSLSGRQELY